MRDVDHVQVTPGRQLEVRFEQAGAEHRLGCRMVTWGNISCQAFRRSNDGGLPCQVLLFK
jgi:hypothetical protein